LLINLINWGQIDICIRESLWYQRAEESVAFGTTEALGIVDTADV
jgi:hypothetical protein